MKKFSEIPQFILTEYLEKILESAPESTITSDVVGTEVLFVDGNNLTGDDTDYVKGNLTYTVGDKASQTSSYLRSPERTIVTKGGKRIETYVETDTTFEEIGITPFTTGYFEAENDYDGYNYNFDISAEIYPVPSSTISYTVSGNNYSFTYYDAFTNYTQKTVDEKAGYNVYFRKDSVFYDGLENNYPDYANTNKDFLFLGKIYPYFSYDGKCRIYRFIYKDFIINALPINNRTDKLVKFITHSFDEVYSKVYNKLTNVETLYDGYESDANFIDDLSNSLYNTDLDLYGLEKEERIRELARNIPILLKKKGTYSSFIGIGEMTSGFSETDDVNDINIYEWGHDTLPYGQYTVPTSGDDGYEEICYTNLYSDSGPTGCAGDSYYNRYTSAYPDFYDANVFSSVGNSYIHTQVISSENGEVKHFIKNTKLIIQCFDLDYKEVFPANIEIQDNSQVNITFNKSISGYCIIIAAEYGEQRQGIYWDINHNINKKTVLTQSFNTVNERFLPVSTLLVDYDNSVIDIDLDNSGGYGYFIESDFVYYNTVASSIWTIQHGSSGLMFVQVYDDNDNLLMPKSVQHGTDLNTTTIEFSSDTTGYAILKHIGNPSGLEERGKILSPHFKVEFDLTCKPVDTEAIFSDTTAENLLKNGEDTRPANRVAHYHGVFAPLTDYSGSIYGVYSQRFDPYGKSTCSLNREFENVSVHIQQTESSLGEVTHKLKTTNVVVKAFDGDYNEIVPSSVEIESGYKINVYFDHSITGYIVVMESDDYGISYDADFYFLHNLGKNIISQFYTFDKDNIVFPETVKNYSDRILVENSESGTLQLVAGNLLGKQSVLSTTGNINHNFDTSGVVVEFYDENWEKIIPESLTLTDMNSCTSVFSEAISGYGVIKDIGLLEFKEDIENDLITNGAVVKLGDGTDETYIDGTNLTSIQNEVVTKEVTNTSNKTYIYTYGNDLFIDIDLGINEEYDIKEIGIFNSKETRMYFYSQGSQLYKYPGYTMTIHFRVKYDDIQ